MRPRHDTEGIDAIPVLSQIKSAVQAGCGDLHGAEQTQHSFSKQCAIVSQVSIPVMYECQCDAGRYRTGTGMLCVSDIDILAIHNGACDRPVIGPYIFPSRCVRPWKQRLETMRPPKTPKRPS